MASFKQIFLAFYSGKTCLVYFTLNLYNFNIFSEHFLVFDSLKQDCRNLRRPPNPSSLRGRGLLLNELLLDIFCFFTSFSITTKLGEFLFSYSIESLHNFSIFSEHFLVFITLKRSTEFTKAVNIVEHFYIPFERL